jgi:hypothetical protein
MISRCRGKTGNRLKYYSSKGITVCDKWLYFTNFYSDMGDPPSEKHSIDRINSKLSYSKKNCRWADKKQQSFNRDYCNKIKIKGVIKSQAEWIKLLSVNHKNFFIDIKNGKNRRKALIDNAKTLEWNK